MAPAPEVPVTASREIRAGTVRGVDGYFRVGQDGDDRWWLIGPDGARFYAKCVHAVRNAESQADGALPRDAAAQMRAWGFNAAGIVAETAGREDGLPFMTSVEFCDAAPAIAAPGLFLPDVFDREWPRRARDRASAVCAPWIQHRELLGWVTDDRLAWAPPAIAGRPSLLQLCLSLEPSLAAYHAAWEFVLALHGGRLDTLARAWGAALPNKETLRALTRAEEGLGTRGYLRDDARWTREFARRYFTSTAAAIRAADPNHLVFGCRFRSIVGPNILAECAYPIVDVAMPDWRELPALDLGDPTNPVMAGEVNWVSPEFLKLPTAARVMRFTSVEWMLRRGRASLERMARNPAVVGYAWSRWQDEPGEQPPFARGLMHVNGGEAREHTELLAQFNTRAEYLRHNSIAMLAR